MVRLPGEDTSQPFSGATFPQFAVGFIAIIVVLVLIACLVAAPTAPSVGFQVAEYWNPVPSRRLGAQDRKRHCDASPYR